MMKLMNKKAITLIALILITVTTFAQDKNFKQDGNEFTIQNGNSTLKLSFCTPKVFRVRYSWDGKFENQESYMVQKYSWDAIKLNSNQTQDSIIINSDSLRVVVAKSPLAINLEVRKISSRPF